MQLEEPLNCCCQNALIRMGVDLWNNPRIYDGLICHAEMHRLLDFYFYKIIICVDNI